MRTGWSVGAAVALLCTVSAATEGADCGKVSQCNQASTPFGGTEQIYIVQNGGKRTTLGNLANYILGLIAPTTSSVPGISLGAYASGSAETTTGDIIAGQTALALGTATFDIPSTCNVQTLTLCGILIGRAGAPYASPTAPPTPAVAGYCSPQLLTGNTTNGSKLITGTSVYIGLTIGDTITGTGIPGGTTITDFNVTAATVRISQNATATNTGVVLTATDPCDASYSFRIATFDGNGGVGAPTAPFSTAAGPRRFSTWNVVCLTWGQPAGSFAGYAIWASTDGGVTYRFMATADAIGAGACSAAGSATLTWAGRYTIRPWWIPEDPSVISASGLNDWFVSRVISGGGTANLVLADAAPVTATYSAATNSGLVMHDDTAGYTAWIAALNAASGTQGYVPPGTYRTRAGGVLTSAIPIVGAKGATILPFGSAVGATIGYLGNTLGTAYTATNNFQEGTGCIPLSSIAGLSVGDYLLIRQLSPGGPTQSTSYALIGTVTALQCESAATGVRLSDAAPVTFTDAAHTEAITITASSIQPTDTVSISVTGDLTCTALYTITSADTTLHQIAEGLALTWNSTCPGGFASNTAGVVTVQTPSYYTSLNWQVAVTHPGGGNEAMSAAPGPSYTVEAMPHMISHVGVSGLTIDARDGTGNLLAPIIGIEPWGTAHSTFSDLTLRHFNGGAGALFGVQNYAPIYSSINVTDGAGGAPNITSFSDVALLQDTNAHITDIQSIDPASFGFQIAGTSYANAKGITHRGAGYGRGIKLCAALGSELSDISSSNAVFDSIAVACGTYRNLLTNVRASYSYGITGDGITFFDSYDRLNNFVNFKSAGHRYDIEIGRSDTNNTWTAGDIGGGGGFGTVYDNEATNVFYSTNGCPAAINQGPVGTSTTPTCQISNGTWTPTLGGATTPGSTTYSTQVGTWQRNWHTMTAQFALTTDSVFSGMTGEARIAGFPLPAAVGGDNGTCSFGAWSGAVTLDAGYTQLAGIMLTGAAGTMNFFESGSTKNTTALDIGSFANSVLLFGTCVYRIW